MNRRAFLAALVTAPAALAFDPDRALWVPGAKLISVPAPRVPRWMRPLLEVGDVVTFGQDPQRYVVMQSGDPQTALGELRDDLRATATISDAAGTG